ncbi:MAG: hypothetical protein F2625_03665 [Actinobacteria bacterium]|uniref:Unannotated protein n=1 Tax=freshwater metagenome TaxID=449393 RepID=A0A6J6KH45_9ZZZZ|nr:hypothetical protein [Actinomycetota bacterium]
MKTSLATMLSVTGVLAAGALAFAVNTSVLDHAVTTSEAAPTLQADVVSLSNLAPIGATAPAATTQAAPTPAPAVTAEVAAAVAAQSTYNIDGVAAITLALSDNSLSVVSVTPAGGYTAAATAVSASRIEVVLTRSNSVMKFSAQVLDGRIVTSVVAEQPRVTSTAPSKYNDDEGDDDDREHEENENDEREGDDD